MSVIKNKFLIMELNVSEIIKSSLTKEEYQFNDGCWIEKGFLCWTENEDIARVYDRYFTKVAKTILKNEGHWKAFTLDVMYPIIAKMVKQGVNVDGIWQDPTTLLETIQNDIEPTIEEFSEEQDPEAAACCAIAERLAEKFGR